MEMSRAMPAARPTARPVALFIGSCVAGAAATAWLAWTYLPYERLERFSPEERFLAWEGIVWLLALVLGFLGLACVLQVAGWRIGSGIGNLVRRLSGADRDHPVVLASAVLPWWMIAYAFFLILIASWARSFIAP